MIEHMKFKVFFLFLFVLLTIARPLHAQCSITENVVIPDLTPVTAEIIVEGSTNADLSGNQAVCGIYLEFEHEQVGDLTIDLISPDGQSITLIGPTGSFGSTAFTDWQILFLPCAAGVSPDPGFADVWNNNQPWGILADYTGSYYPYLGCLEDFDQGSINGTWSLEIVDNTFFDLGELIDATIFFCDESGLDCIDCEANAGEFDVDDIVVCSAEADTILLDPIFTDGAPSDDYQFFYVLRQDQNIISIEETLDMTGLPTGTYQVCGLSIHLNDLSSLLSFEAGSFDELQIAVDQEDPIICGALNEDCVNVFLVQSPAMVDLNVIICEGDSYTFHNEIYSNSELYTITIPQANGCDSVYQLNLQTVSIEASISSDTTILTCSNSLIILDGTDSTLNSSSSFSWTSEGGGFVGSTTEEFAEINQPGLYILSITDGLCVSTDSIEILIDDELPTISLVGDTLTCINQSVNIDFSSFDTIVDVSWVGPNGFTSNLEDIDVEYPGSYTVIAEADNGCVASESISISQGGNIPIIELTASSLSCAEPQASINVLANSNSLTYLWSGPNGFLSSVKNPMVFEPGIYNVLATDSLGCVGQYSIEIEGSLSEVEFNLDIGEINCPNGDAEVILFIDDPNAFVEWTFPDMSSALGLSISTSQVGQYSVNVISNGCQTIEFFEVTENLIDIPVAQPFQSAIIDCTNLSATIFLNITENAGFIDSVQWFGPNGFLANTQSIDVILSGTYTVVVYSNEGCISQFEYELQFDTEVPSVNAEIFPLTCENDNQRIITTSTSDLTYFWDGPNSFASSDSIIENLVSGDYFLTVTNQENCSREYFYTVTADTLSNDIELNVSGILSCFSDTVSIMPQFIEIDNVSWTSDNGFSSSEINVKVDQPGLYFIQAEGIDNGCWARDTVEVFQDLNEPDLIVEDQSFFCGETTLALEAISLTSNLVYSWTGPAGFTSSLISPIVTEEGQYAVTVTSLNGCTSAGEINVTQDNNQPDISASISNDLDCINTQSIITGSTTTSNVTFIWRGPDNSTYDDPVITVDEPGNYTFVVTADNGCADSVIINVPFTGIYPEFFALGDTLNCGEVLTLIDVLEITGGVTYSWTGPNGFTSNSVFNQDVEAGEYILTGVGANNCVSVDTTYVVIDTTAAQLSLLNSVDTLTCLVPTTTIELSTDKDFVDLMWSGPLGFSNSNLSIEVSTPGTYFFTGITDNDCESNLEIEIIQDINLPSFSTIADTLDCNNPSSTISLSNDDSEAVYSWQGPNFTSALQSPSVEEEGIYVVTVTGVNGCELVDSIEVFKDILEPDFVAVDDTLPCDGSSIEIFVLSLSEGAIVSWMGPAGFDSVGPSPTTDILGVYFIEVVGQNGCTANGQIEIFDAPEKPNFGLEKSSDITCEFPMVTLNSLETSDDISLIWTGPNNISSIFDTITTDMAGMYYLEVTGQTGCSKVDSIEIMVDTIVPQIEIQQIGRILCDINNVAISGLGSVEGTEYEYKWSTEDGTINQGAESLEPSIGGAGTYTLQVFNTVNKCFNEESIEVAVEESTLESVITAVDKQTCKDYEDGVLEVLGVVGGVAPYRYAFQGNSFTENGYFDELPSAVYNLIVKDSFGCVLDTAIWLGLERNLQVNLGNDTLIDLGERLNLAAIVNIPTVEILDIIWEPSSIIDCNNCLNFDFEPATNMVVKIEIVDIEGCTAEDQIIVRVNEEVNLYIPNIFTPNNDGVNDVFSLSTSRNVERVISFDVYDRWGSKVFSDADFVPGEGLTWDGRHLGQKVQQGVFVYLAKLQMVNGEIEQLKGNITVIR